MYFINKIEDFWHGNITLWKSYWLVGELFNALILIIILNIELKLFNNTHFFYKSSSNKFQSNTFCI